jgi:hypothetical protein
MVVHACDPAMQDTSTVDLRPVMGKHARSYMKNNKSKKPQMAGEVAQAVQCLHSKLTPVLQRKTKFNFAICFTFCLFWLWSLYC